MKNLFKYMLVTVLALNLIFTLINNYSIFSLATTLSYIENKIELWEIYHKSQIKIILRAVNDLDRFQRTDIKELEKIKESNFSIINLTNSTQSSGTHIKINNKSYILSVNHIIDKLTDEYVLITGENGRHTLKIIKYDKKNDLALFKNSELNLSYLEIGDIEPKEGSKIITIGNPHCFVDMITEGVVCKKIKGGYLFTNKIFFGSSGGAVIYKGKLVGVVSQMRTFTTKEGPSIVTYGYATGLKRIKEFLKDIK